MVRLYVTEKPSVARDLARVVGARRKEDGYLAGDGVWVTWSYGHLLEIAEPRDHDPRWRRWDLAALPMLPERLLLRPIARTRAHLGRVVRLLNHPEVAEVVNACDAGREGELIFRYLLERARCRKPVLRLWLASLTPAAIRAALDALRPGSDYDALGAAARCRAEADWLVGLNVTRAMTCQGGTLLSVGRVQTPTLALVVAREQEIACFRPEDYFEVEARLSASSRDGAAWTARWFDPKGKGEEAFRLASREAAQAISDAVAGRPGAVVAVERRTQEIPPPLLHHLTSLQQTANRRFGLTAEQTLTAAQALYERRKAITYPRTDSRHLSAAVAAGAADVVRGLTSVAPVAGVAQALVEGGVPPLTRRFVDDARVGDHHAIVPTGRAVDPARLGRDEARVFELVARRFLAAFHGPARYAKTRLDAEVAGHPLRAAGRVRLEAGWEVAEPPPPPRRGEAAEAALPAVEEGEAVRCQGAAVAAKQTRPPPRYSEATLLAAMERAGNDLDDQDLRAAMRQAGLGTAATRAATIETLLRRGYVRRGGKSLVAQPTGAALIRELPVDVLKSAELTGAWEWRLERMARGLEDPAAFRQAIRAFAAQAVSSVRAATVDVPQPADGGRAGRGGRGGRAGRGDGGGRGARGRRAARGGRGGSEGARAARRGRADAATRPEGGRPGRGQGSGRRLGAARRTRTAGREAAPAEACAPRSGPRCKACRRGAIIRGRRGWGCDRWREGCRFVVWFVQDGVAVPADEADRLFRRGQTRLFAAAPTTGKQARLVLDLEAPGNVRWEETRRGR